MKMSGASIAARAWPAHIQELAQPIKPVLFPEKKFYQKTSIVNHVGFAWRKKEKERNTQGNAVTARGCLN